MNLESLWIKLGVDFFIHLFFNQLNTEFCMYSES